MVENLKYLKDKKIWKISIFFWKSEKPNNKKNKNLKISNISKTKIWKSEKSRFFFVMENLTFFPKSKFQFFFFIEINIIRQDFNINILITPSGIFCMFVLLPRPTTQPPHFTHQFPSPSSPQNVYFQCSYFDIFDSHVFIFWYFLFFNFHILDFQILNF